MPEGTNITQPKGEKRAAPIGSRVLEGPITRDFDEFYGFHHAGEMLTWIEQDIVTDNLKSSEEMLPTHLRKLHCLHSSKKDSPFLEKRRRPSFTASMSNSTGPRAVRMGRDGSVLAVLPFVAILIVPYHISEILIPPFILGDSLA